MKSTVGRAWHARRLRLRCAALALVMTIGAGAAAQERTFVAAVGTSAPESMVLHIALNKESKGEYFVTVLDGAFLVRRQDLKAMGLTTVGGRTWQSGADEFIWINSIPGVQATFDESKLALDLVADPKLLPANTVDLWAGRGPNVTYPDNASAFFNYDIGYAGGNSGWSNGVFGVTELGIRTGNFLFLNDTTCASNTSASTCVRLSTSLTHDNRETLVRTIAGDFAFTTGNLGTALAMGGLSYSKLYDIDPYFIRYPQQSLTGQLRTPSEVDIYLDGQRVRTLRLPAGDYDLRNITQTTGAHAVDVVIRDAFGREQRTNTSYYASERSLKAGLHEYSYNVGALRQNFGVESNDYGPLAFAGFHRYGVSDRLTVGVRAEGKSGLVSGGPSATFVVDSLGIVNVGAGASEFEGRTGGAAFASYSYLGQHWNWAAFARKDSPHYANLIHDGFLRRNWEAAGNIGYSSPAFGSLNVGYYTFDAYQGQDRKAANATYGRPLLDGRASFFVTVVAARAEERRNDVFAGFTYNFDASYLMTGYYQRLRGNTMESLQFQKNLPVGEGLGYVVGVQHFTGDAGSSTQLSPSFQYNGRWATLRGYAQQSDVDGSPRSYAFSVSGGVAWAGGMVAAGRPVTDSFGVVKVDELEGVRVFVNNQEIGKTGPDGRLFVPSLSSFNDNQISIDVGSVPIDYAFPESVRVVSPAYRAGAVVDFHARELRAYVGVLRLVSGDRSRPAEYFDATLDVAGKPFAFITGRGGEFYIEDLPPGRYRGQLKSNGTRCSFELDVRPGQGPLTDLGETACQQEERSSEPARLR